MANALSFSLLTFSNLIMIYLDVVFFMFLNIDSIQLLATMGLYFLSSLEKFWPLSLQVLFSIPCSLCSPLRTPVTHILGHLKVSKACWCRVYIFVSLFFFLYFIFGCFYSLFFFPLNFQICSQFHLVYFSFH